MTAFFPGARPSNTCAGETATGACVQHGVFTCRNAHLDRNARSEGKGSARHRAALRTRQEGKRRGCLLVVMLALHVRPARVFRFEQTSTRPLRRSAQCSL